MKRRNKYLAISPGEIIKEQLETFNVSLEEFKNLMDLSLLEINDLLEGRLNLTHEISLKLEKIFGIEALFYENLEFLYRETLVKIENESLKEDDLKILKDLPIKEMMSLGFIQFKKNELDIKKEVLNFFDVCDLSSIFLDKKMIYCRKLEDSKKSNIALLTMFQEAQNLSKNIKVNKINIELLKKNLNKIKSLSILDIDSFKYKLKDILKECGIVLLIMPSLKGSYLQGFTFKEEDKIVLTLTLRGKTNDKFWFNLFHELAHIILGHLDENIYVLKEEDANMFASNSLINKRNYINFLRFFKINKEDIINFSYLENIHPGILVGRLQKDKVISYKMFNELKVSYKYEDFSDLY